MQPEWVPAIAAIDQQIRELRDAINQLEMKMTTVLTDDGLELTNGDVWHVRLPGENEVRKMKIVDVTPKTIQLMEMPRSMVQLRYEIERVKLIEKVQ